jgi:hypothetical protein
LIPMGPFARSVARTGTPFTSGMRVTLPGGRPPPVATVTRPFASVLTLATYFDDWPSQPQVLAAGAGPPPR